MPGVPEIFRVFAKIGITSFGGGLVAYLRDALVTELSQHVQLSTIASDDGSLSVFVAGSQPLVLGQRANSLAVTRDAADSAQIRISFVQGSVQTELADATIGGGGSIAAPVRAVAGGLAGNAVFLGLMLFFNFGRNHGLEATHCLFTVLQLTALFLTTCYSPGGFMNQSHCR
jgi:hypothetical protein